MTLVKICGLREPAHALAAAEAGADLIGLVFAESPRRVTVEEAQAIVRALGEPVVRAAGGTQLVEALLRQKRPLVVGVFAGADADTVNRTADAVGLDLVQLSGDEPWEMCHEISLSVLKAVKVRDDATPDRLISAFRPGAVPLLDTHAECTLGGTGRAFDWRIAASVAHRFPVVLAGGLTPENVGEALRVVRPWAVDVSSGVETDGVKDVGKMQAFVAAVRNST